ncbi:hypothetical protein [Qipengyuania spongiae]|uniref:DUF5679 domain-containing protein n=1 Tax=Qipengyuania spongiae TaxID=2909673 RepID=A0ABY5T3T4_9SPHN|nr:hypothetical protein [Qipengyuania spongiae]UVI40239.1 hypothetical protein L1F33_04665 [Qipengyuania spongiae]
MKLAYLTCALGRHSVDLTNVRRTHGGHVGRCRHCGTALEEVAPFVWKAQKVHDAGLGNRRMG